MPRNLLVWSLLLVLIAATARLVVPSAPVAAEAARPASALDGTWHADVDRHMAELEKRDPWRTMPAPQRRQKLAALREAHAVSRFTFSSGRYVFTLEHETQEGQFNVASMDGDRWTVEMSNAHSSKLDRITVTWSDHDHIAMTVPVPSPDTDQIFLVRQK